MSLSSLINRFQKQDDQYRLKYPVDGELTWKEIRLERSREIGALQRYRYTDFCASATDGERSSSRNLLETEANLRAVVQKEIFLREQLKKGHVDADSQTKRQAKASKRNSNL
jgi:hypothetical protein